MSRQTTIILVLFVIMVLSLGTLYLAKRGAQLVIPPRKTPIISEEKERQKSDKLGGWGVYQNAKDGYEIRYPDSFTLEEAGLGPLFLSPDDVLSRKDLDPHFHTHTMFIVAEKTEPEKSLEDWIKERFALGEFREFESSPEESKWSVNKISSVRISEELEGYFVHEWVQAYPVCHYFFKNKGRVIDLQGKNPKCKENPIFNQMLATFRFLD